MILSAGRCCRSNRNLFPFGGPSPWALFGVASYKRLQNDIATSPIVRNTRSPNQFFSSIGLGYSF